MNHLCILSAFTETHLFQGEAVKHGRETDVY